MNTFFLLNATICLFTFAILTFGSLDSQFNSRGSSQQQQNGIGNSMQQGQTENGTASPPFSAGGNESYANGRFVRSPFENRQKGRQRIGNFRPLTNSTTSATPSTDGDSSTSDGIGRVKRSPCGSFRNFFMERRRGGGFRRGGRRNLTQSTSSTVSSLPTNETAFADLALGNGTGTAQTPTESSSSSGTTNAN